MIISLNKNFKLFVLFYIEKTTFFPLQTMINLNTIQEKRNNKINKKYLLRFWFFLCLNVVDLYLIFTNLLFVNKNIVKFFYVCRNNKQW